MMGALGDLVRVGGLALLGMSLCGGGKSGQPSFSGWGILLDQPSPSALGRGEVRVRGRKDAELGESLVGGAMAPRDEKEDCVEEVGEAECIVVVVVAGLEVSVERCGDDIGKGTLG